MSALLLARAARITHPLSSRIVDTTDRPSTVAASAAAAQSDVPASDDIIMIPPNTEAALPVMRRPLATEEEVKVKASGRVTEPPRTLEAEKQAERSVEPASCAAPELLPRPSDASAAGAVSALTTHAGVDSEAELHGLGSTAAAAAAPQQPPQTGSLPRSASPEPELAQPPPQWQAGGASTDAQATADLAATANMLNSREERVGAVLLPRNPAAAGSESKGVVTEATIASDAAQTGRISARPSLDPPSSALAEKLPDQPPHVLQDRDPSAAAEQEDDCVIDSSQPPCPSSHLLASQLSCADGVEASAQAPSMSGSTDCRGIHTDPKEAVHVLVQDSSAEEEQDENQELAQQQIEGQQQQQQQQQQSEPEPREAEDDSSTVPLASVARPIGGHTATEAASSERALVAITARWPTSTEGGPPRQSGGTMTAELEAAAGWQDPSVRAQLVLLPGQALTKWAVAPTVVPLRKDVSVVGREVGNDIVLTQLGANQISRQRHATIFLPPVGAGAIGTVCVPQSISCASAGAAAPIATPCIEDCTSRNGIFVNKRKVSRSPLRSGDVITFGGGGNLPAGAELPRQRVESTLSYVYRDRGHGHQIYVLNISLEGAENRPIGFVRIQPTLMLADLRSMILDELDEPPPGRYRFLQRTQLSMDEHVAAPVSAKQEHTMSALGLLPTAVLRVTT
jgi:pSer/pThr/pTyr-binding forkhead associated (FHA) protein